MREREWHQPGEDYSRPVDGPLADEAELGMLLERMYAARAAHAAPPDEALARLNATLDRVAPPSRGRLDHSRVFGARALAALAVLLILSSVGLSRLASGTHATTPPAAPPITAAASIPQTVATVGQEDVARGSMPGAPNSAQATTSDTPLRDLLGRAGIHAADPPGGSTTETRPPLN